jgi:hypothetical protein
LTFNPIAGATGSGEVNARSLPFRQRPRRQLFDEITLIH